MALDVPAVLNMLPKSWLRFGRGGWEAMANGWHKRQKTDVLPVRVGKKKKYIFFPGYGAILVLTFFVLTMFAINYNNNLGIACICFLSVLFVYSIFQNHYTALRPLRLLSMTADPSEVGQDSVLRFRFVYDKPTPDPPLCALEVHGAQFVLNFSPEGMCEVAVPFTAQETGVFQAPRMQVSTRWPHSITMTWVHLKLPGVIAVVPAPGPNAPGALGDDDEAKKRRPERALHGDVSGIRVVHPQEKTSKIAWKPTWRHNTSMTYVWEDAKNSCVLIHWPEGSEDVPAKIQWVRDRMHAATTAQRPFQLIHPDFVSKIGGGDVFARSTLSHLMTRLLAPTPWPSEAS